MSQISQREAPALALARMTGGTTMERHQHPGHQLIYVSTGVLVAQTPAGSWVASRDRAIWVPAGTWHEHRAYGAAVIHTVGFDVGAPPLDPAAPAIVAVTGLVHELLLALTDPETPPPEADRLRAVLRDRLRRTSQEPISLPSARDPRLACACRIALEQMETPVPLSALADAARTTERTLSRLFQQETGMSYPQWRAQARAIHAMILLAQGESVTDTASLCGWSTTSAFIDSFRRAMGQTPGAYRDLAVTETQQEIPAARQNPPAAHLIGRTGCRPVAPTMGAAAQITSFDGPADDDPAAAPTTPDERAGDRVCPSRWAPLPQDGPGHRQ